MPDPFERADKGGYRDVWTVRGLEPVPRRWKGEGKGREGETKGGASRRGPWLVEVRGKAGQKRTVLLWMRFLKREGKKCSADEGTIEKGTLGLVQLGWSWSWAGQGRTGQDNSARGSKSRCEGCRMQPGGDCMGFERNEDRRKRGQVSRFPGF